jgi:hypothetical protein
MNAKRQPSEGGGPVVEEAQASAVRLRVDEDIIKFALIKTRRRLTFDITYQREDTKYKGEDDGPYYSFRASNGYEAISRSRMDIQTERLWLLGASADERSGSMVFSSDEKRDRAYVEFLLALAEWEAHVREGLWGQASGRSPGAT